MAGALVREALPTNPASLQPSPEYNKVKELGDAERKGWQGQG